MASTETRTLKPVQAARTYDCLYDPTYTVSNARDFSKSVAMLNTAAGRLEIAPHFNTMFTDSTHVMRNGLRFVPDPVPPTVSRVWPGYADQRRELILRYKTFNYAPHIKVPEKEFETVQAGGKDQYKYFHRPIIPFVKGMQPTSVALAQRLDLVRAKPSKPEPPTKTVSVQTDYRESETQTDPFSPNYVMAPGPPPEVYTLASLAYGHGLPAGLAEVEMIERARQKRKWEESLPDIGDKSQLEKRQRMMEEQQCREWAVREREIEKLQELQLETLEKMLRKREEDHDALNTKRLEHMWAQRQIALDRRVKRIRKHHSITLRRLAGQFEDPEGTLHRRDVVADYDNPASQPFAPMTRIGVFPDRNSEKNAVHNRFLDTYQGLLELEQSLPTFLTEPRIRLPPSVLPGKGTKAGRYRKRKEELDSVYESLQMKKTAPQEMKPELKLLVKVEKPIPRPPTPTITKPSQDEEEEELAIIFLQKLIRGRAIQNMMFEGKESRLELIRELRTTHALQSDKVEKKLAEQREVEEKQSQRQREERYFQEFRAGAENEPSAEVGRTLDFLNKELFRLQEERRIHAFVLLAERQRRLREAEESGRRQVEERRRRAEDEMFRQVVKVHQESVNTYLEDIILTTIHREADEQARHEVRLQAEKINEAAFELEQHRTRKQTEEIVAELVHTFALPEVEKQMARMEVKRRQRQHLLAAHQAIHEGTERLIRDLHSDNQKDE